MPKPDQCTMALKATANTLSAKPIQINVVSMSVSAEGSATSIKITKFRSGGDQGGVEPPCFALHYSVYACGLPALRAQTTPLP